MSEIILNRSPPLCLSALAAGVSATAPLVSSQDSESSVALSLYPCLCLCPRIVADRLASRHQTRNAATPVTGRRFTGQQDSRSPCWFLISVSVSHNLRKSWLRPWLGSASMMNPVAPSPYTGAAPPPQPPALSPFPPPSAAFWNAANVHDRLKELHDTINLAEALKTELEVIIRANNVTGNSEGSATSDASVDSFSRFLCVNNIDLKCQELLSLEAANALISTLRAQLEPFRIVADESSPWEEKSAALRLSNKLDKYKRNKLWRKRKRKRVAEKLAMETDRFEQADKEADEWRAREIAKDAANQKVQKMKEIAKRKEKEERRKLESDLELALMVEKLQELRSIRIQKLKKQGRFLPEEDDKFLERVKAAVEEEERQAMAAAGTGAAKDAIANAEESRKATQSYKPDSKDAKDEKEHGNNDVKDKTTSSSEKEHGNNGGGGSSANDSVSNLPMEFYHYYYGSNHDMGTLIEVRRAWDSYIRPGGSRIPGHWVQPPPPADEIWASCLVESPTSRPSNSSPTEHVRGCKSR
nr:U11/U12 small nuclear ribonucleoprotein 59 kDa protein isoform X1 [Ipomoea batatas]